MSTLFLLESINEYRPGYIETIATEYGQPNTSQTYGCPADPDNLWHLNCFSGCGGTRSKPSTTQEIIDWALNRSFTYVVITDGFYSSYKTEVDNYISRGGKVYKLTSKSGCSGPDCHCYYISFDIIVLCVSNWQCELGYTGYMSDGCGNRKPDSACIAPCPEVGVSLSISEQ